MQIIDINQKFVQNIYIPRIKYCENLLLLTMLLISNLSRKLSARSGDNGGPIANPSARVKNALLKENKFNLNRHFDIFGCLTF